MTKKTKALNNLIKYRFSRKKLDNDTTDFDVMASTEIIINGVTKIKLYNKSKSIPCKKSGVE